MKFDKEKLIGKIINIDNQGEVKKAIIKDIEENEDGTQDIVFMFEDEMEEDYE